MNWWRFNMNSNKQKSDFIVWYLITVLSKNIVDFNEMVTYQHLSLVPVSKTCKTLHKFILWTAINLFIKWAIKIPAKVHHNTCSYIESDFSRKGRTWFGTEFKYSSNSQNAMIDYLFNFCWKFFYESFGNIALSRPFFLFCIAQ